MEQNQNSGRRESATPPTRPPKRSRQDVDDEETIPPTKRARPSEETPPARPTKRSRQDDDGDDETMHRAKRVRPSTPTSPTRPSKRSRRDDDDDDEEDTVSPTGRARSEEPLEKLKKDNCSSLAARTQLSPSASSGRTRRLSVNSEPSNVPIVRILQSTPGSSPVRESKWPRHTHRNLWRGWKPSKRAHKSQECSKEKLNADKVDDRPDDENAGRNSGKKPSQVPPHQQRKNDNSPKSLTDSSRSGSNRNPPESNTAPGPKRHASIADIGKENTMAKRKSSEASSSRPNKIQKLTSSADVRVEKKLGEQQHANLDKEKQKSGVTTLNEKLRGACNPDLPTDNVELSNSVTTSNLGSALSKTNDDASNEDIPPTSVPDTSNDFHLAQLLSAQFERERRKTASQNTHRPSPQPEESISEDAESTDNRDSSDGSDYSYSTNYSEEFDPSEDDEETSDEAYDEASDEAADEAADEADNDTQSSPELIVSAQTGMLEIIELCNKHPQPSRAIQAELRDLVKSLPALLTSNGGDEEMMFVIEVWQHSEIVRWGGPECLEKLKSMLKEMELFDHLTDLEPKKGRARYFAV